MAKAEIDMIDVAKKITLEIKVKIKKDVQFKIRTFLGIKIIKFAMFILPNATKLEVEEVL
jgi:hypothetical protein